MIIKALEAVFLFITTPMMAYLIRHYVFTLTVLRRAKKAKVNAIVDKKYEPAVSILIPARNEEKAIGRLLQ